MWRGRWDRGGAGNKGFGGRGGREIGGKMWRRDRRRNM